MPRVGIVIMTRAEAYKIFDGIKPDKQAASTSLASAARTLPVIVI
jgi:hypothetical protein